MGVYINGMEMPKNCNECPLHFYEGQGICCCRALPAIDDGEILKPWKNKRKDCPLVQMPPHGDLIDRNETIKALWKALYEYEDRTEKQFVESSELDVADWILHRIFVQNMSDIDRQTILQMPTIIQAEEGDYS